MAAHRAFFKEIGFGDLTGRSDWAISVALVAEGRPLNVLNRYSGPSPMPGEAEVKYLDVSSVTPAMTNRTLGDRSQTE